VITEAITIGVILGACAVSAWFAKTRFQPGIDMRLAKIAEEAIVARRKNHND